MEEAVDIGEVFLAGRGINNGLKRDAEERERQKEDKHPKDGSEHDTYSIQRREWCYYLGMPRLADALKHLKRVDATLYRATKAHHTSLPAQLSGKKTRAQLFTSLISTVISQQLGLAAADAIFSRVKKVCKGRMTPEAVLRVSPAAFREAGLSGAKIKTLKAIARAVKNNSLDLLSLKMVSEAQATERLMEVWGLGSWSAEMFLMFALGRPDVFSPGDLGLVRAMETIYGLPKNPPRASLLVIAEKWSPHRTYASLLLWRSRDTKAG